MGQLKPRGAEGGRLDGPSGTAEAAELESISSTRLGKYLRRLREGYGYTLRKVEERAMAMGEAIDNSQLSPWRRGRNAAT